MNKGEDEEEFSSAPEREFSKNVQLSGIVRMNAAGSQSCGRARSAPPPLHPAPPCITISPVHSQSESRVEGSWGGVAGGECSASRGKKGEDEEGGWGAA